MNDDERARSIPVNRKIIKIKSRSNRESIISNPQAQLCRSNQFNFDGGLSWVNCY